MVQISQDNGILQSNPTAQETQSVAQQLRYPLDSVTQEILREFVQSIAGQLPVGSVYMNVTDSRNPNLILGYGTWTAIEGYVVAGYKSGDPNFGTAGATVGSATHTLTIDEMPAHDHMTGSYLIQGNATAGSPVGVGVYGGVTLNSNQYLNIASEGNGDAHNNVQPTLVAYVWQRTA